MSARRRRETTGLSDSNDDSEGSHEIPDPRLLADEQRQALQEQQLVREAVGALPERCRELITMLFYKKDELSYADIAQRMDMPIASIGPTRARCLEKLKKLLEGRI
jgi:RNA polymerase sigma factor (sigma-70 family)